MNSDFYKEITKRLDRSSLSLIHYFPVDSSSPDDSINNSNEYEIYTKSDKEKDTVISKIQNAIAHYLAEARWIDLSQQNSH
jgi:hypothetical protein